MSFYIVGVVVEKHTAAISEVAEFLETEARLFAVRSCEMCATSVVTSCVRGETDESAKSVRK